jgi:GTP pyrophosphokinase
MKIVIMEYTDKLVREARMVAVKAHGNQSYDDIFPYEKHLDDVVEVLKRFDFGNKYLIGGYLHDTMEDGAISFNKIKRYFGNDIAEITYCVTDEQGRGRKEKKFKTYPKIKSNPDALIIKLADRIANIEHGGKVDMYSSEYEDFRNAIYTGDRMAEPMWAYLEKLLKIETVSQ